ncbi:hypothetical protein [Parasphingopyxis marina]|uniref:Uncharacterized protein n=1 Tax=Parasphingopyxis marina TaxID=2761622 RepID=A0A842I080_9SPHN|nr:hypothetical protein [Parasphingopyxis marina]MBC2777164.1 hypothetical protein [Parasphingopyxis marina]
MSKGAMIFGLWCLMVTGSYSYAAMTGYSPFADGHRADGARGPGGVFIGRGGPRHK